MERKTRIIHLGLGYKILLFAIAIFIAGFSLFFTNNLVEKLKISEKKRIELWAAAYKDVISTDLDQQVSMISFQIIGENESIPVIMVDENEKIISFANLDSLKAESEEYLQSQLHKMKDANEPIVVEYSSEHRNYIYYKDSFVLTLLQKYPYYQFSLVILFVLVTYILLVISKRAEDNSIWVGMSRETAHQLGTPISSLIAWVEMLKIQQPDDPLLPEVRKDVKRLETITERFARIGSPPKLIVSDINDVVQNVVDYLKVRTSSRVEYELNKLEDDLPVEMNISLIQWVVENICKNAIDAMSGVGKITIDVVRDKKNVVIDFTDTGKGIVKREFKKIFKPGFSSKKFGWGLGLALVKRIVEEYHDGKVYVVSSEIDKGTTFRVELKIVENF
ncbi:MAG: HAMP domain-containing histidine kinase [Bacteroidales bacterium]|nr:HAMP domain-containing histidine kinase [Bacteroidales bacterium]